MSVYTCLFSSTLLSPGRFRYSAIVGWKKFIQTRDMKDDGTIITFNPPQAIFNNPGQYVFPGGRAKPGEEHFDGALREFGEETGVLFTRDGAIPAPVADANGTPLYSCAYIKTANETDLGDLANIIRTNIGYNDPTYTPSDELYTAAVITLQSYQPYVLTADCTNYCTTHDADLRTLRDRATWTNVLRSGAVPLPPNTPTTQPGTQPAVTGVVDFNQFRYAMRPFMEFMSDPANMFDFPLNRGQRQYSFLKPTEVGSFPSRFSTDWFSSMSELIPHIDPYMV